MARNWSVAAKQIVKHKKQIGYVDRESQAYRRQGAGIACSCRRKNHRRNHYPGHCQGKPQRGKVVAVGNGKKDEPMTVKVGDTVLYGKYSGTELSIEGKDYLMMREADIFAII
jgi:hypothetical protein